MKILIKTTLIVAALLAGSVAQADDRQHQGKRHDRTDQFHSDGKYHHKQQHDNQRWSKHGKQYDDQRWKKRGKHHRANRDVVRLDIPVHVRGSDRIHLRRLINRHYGINLDQYRLKKVVVNNRAHRYGSAKLRVGHHVSQPQYLSRGKNHLRAPQRTDGRWVLGINNARVNNIRVVLEPKYDWAYHHGPRSKPRPWFEDTWRW